MADQRSAGLLANQLANPVTAGASVGNVQRPLDTPPATDGYFAGEEGTVAVFDFDYETIKGFYTKWGMSCLAFNPACWVPSCLCCLPCFLKRNVEWNTHSQHIALTVDGIRYVKERRKSCWGLHCCDKGKESKTVPYDKITDCDVREPAGTACCCCVPRVLSAVHVDTASSGPTQDGKVKHELDIHGLRFAGEFKKAVWAMKRGEAPPNAAVPLQEGMQCAPGQQSMNTQLLMEIRDELRTLNAHMSAGGSPTVSSYPKIG